MNIKMIFKSALKIIYLYIFKILILIKNIIISKSKIGYTYKFKVSNHGIENKIILQPSIEIYKTNITINGNANKVEIGENTILHNSIILINGDNNIVSISSNSKWNGLEIDIKNNNKFYSGQNSTSNGKVEVHIKEGTTLEIGSDCMFSRGIIIRTSDGHLITDLSGKRINNAKSIFIGDKVWISQNVIILKGVKLCSNLIIGVGSVVTKSIEKNNSIIGGNPAIIIKTNIDWDRNLL